MAQLEIHQDMKLTSAKKNINQRRTQKTPSLSGGAIEIHNSGGRIYWQES